MGDMQSSVGKKYNGVCHSLFKVICLSVYASQRSLFSISSLSQYPYIMIYFFSLVNNCPSNMQNQAKTSFAVYNFFFQLLVLSISWSQAPTKVCQELYFSCYYP